MCLNSHFYPVVVLSDLHVPDYNWKVIHLILTLISEIQNVLAPKEKKRNLCIVFHCNTKHHVITKS
jgi:hypothetical protein